MQCAVSTCKNTPANTRRLYLKGKGPLVTFHRFPTDKSLRKLWIKACGRKKQFFRPSEQVRICSDHFTEDGFVRDLRAELLNAANVQVKERKVLKPDAVPTLKLPSAQHSVKTVSELEREKLYENKARKALVNQILEEASKSNEDASGSEQLEVNEVERVLQVKWQLEEARKDEHSTTNSTGTEFNQNFLNQDKNCPLIVKMLNNLGEHLLKDPVANSEDSTAGANSLQSLQREIDKLEKKKTILELSLAKTKHELDKAMHLYRSSTDALKQEVQMLKLSRPSFSQVDSEVSEVLETFLTETQINIILNGCKKPKWTLHELSMALNLRKISERAYVYMQNELNYPLPEIKVLDHYNASKGNIAFNFNKEMEESDCDMDDITSDDSTDDLDNADCVETADCIEYEIEVSELPPSAES